MSGVAMFVCTQGFTNTGNPGAYAVSTAIAAEVKAGATLVLLNGDICYAECASSNLVAKRREQDVMKSRPVD